MGKLKAVMASGPKNLALLWRAFEALPATDVPYFIGSRYYAGRYRVRPRLLDRCVELRGGTSDASCFNKIFVQQEYECPFLVDDVKFIINAGANTGLSALYFAARYPTATIIAIEPEPENFLTLKRNCAHLPNIAPIQGALWPVSGSVALTASFDGRAWAFSVGRDDMQKLGTVDAYSIPQIMSAYGADQIDILKLDIEGSEKDLFGGDTQWLDRVSTIVIELHDHYNSGCSDAFYGALCGRKLEEETRGENVFVRLMPQRSVRLAHCH